MNLERFFQEMMDFQEENEDYVRLFENYRNSKIYFEIKSFLDIAHPDWRKNRELGTWAPEFVLLIIDMWEDAESEYSFKEWLTNIYEDLDSEYSRFVCSYSSERYRLLDKKFELEHGDNFDRFFTPEEFSKLYDDFKLKDDEEEYWKF